MSTAKLVIKPIEVNFVLKDKVYDALKQAITSMNIYAETEDTRLDERQLSEEFGVSRTPIREAITRLEQEGFVKVYPRRGAFVVRKSKKEILEMITVWAALESMQCSRSSPGVAPVRRSRNSKMGPRYGALASAASCSDGGGTNASAQVRILFAKAASSGRRVGSNWKPVPKITKSQV